MLPSKGYFSSIDCPFYANKLCHRYYCQFRHTKSNSTFSPTSDIIDNLCEDESISEDILKDIVIETRMTSSSNALQNTEFKYSDLKKKSDVKHDKESLKNKSYMLPIDIPQYKPTPISKLMTRQNDSVKECNVQPYNSHITKPDIEKNSLTNNSFDYFDNNGSRDRVIEKVSYSTSKQIVNVTNSLTSLSESSFDQFKDTENCKNNGFDPSNIDLLVRENQKLKEMVLQLKSKSDRNELKRDDDVVMNKRLLMDLVGESEPVKCSSDKILQEQSVVKKDHKSTSSKHRTNKDSKHKSRHSSSSKSTSHKKSSEHKSHSEVKHKEKHKKSKKSDHYSKSTKSITRIESLTNSLSSEQILKKSDQSSKSTKSNTNTNSFRISSSPEVIVISDSEELDNIQSEELDDIDCEELDNIEFEELDNIQLTDESDDNDKEGYSQSTIDSFPQPKKKQRLSHVRQESSGTTTKQIVPKNHNLQGGAPKRETTDSYPQSKQKSRVAHSIKYESVSFQSVGEHVNHWQQVRERMKKKCVNPAGEEGYQNWTKVKISPVSNVSSIMKSKKSIISKIKQWKK